MLFNFGVWSTGKKTPMSAPPWNHKRESAALLKLDMRLPAQVRAELAAGNLQARAVREFMDKAIIRPQLVPTGRHECLRQYFDNVDRNRDGTLDLDEMTRWLPVIGGETPEKWRKAVVDHFSFMDKDSDKAVDYKEFLSATLDAAEQKPSTYNDEQYVKRFGIEIYTFLALAKRHRALRAFDRDAGKCYEPGNELQPFLQFERLVASSQSVFMPYELFAPEDDRKAGNRGRRYGRTQEPRSPLLGRPVDIRAMSGANSGSSSSSGGGSSGSSGSSSSSGGSGSSSSGSSSLSPLTSLAGDKKAPFKLAAVPELLVPAAGPTVGAVSPTGTQRLFFPPGATDGPAGGGDGGVGGSCGGDFGFGRRQQRGGSTSRKDITADVEAALLENRRAWATQRRAEIAAKFEAQQQNKGAKEGLEAGSPGGASGARLRRRRRA